MGLYDQMFYHASCWVWNSFVFTHTFLVMPDIHFLHFVETLETKNEHLGYVQLPLQPHLYSFSLLSLVSMVQILQPPC